MYQSRGPWKRLPQTHSRHFEPVEFCACIKVCHYESPSYDVHDSFHALQVPHRSRSFVEYVLDFRVNAIAKVASMSFASAQKLSCFLGGFGLNAPLLDARYDHIGVK
jgi:hypothetical protein